MRLLAVALMTLGLLAPSDPAIALSAEASQARWVHATEQDAARVVTVEVLSGRRVASRWRFPVRRASPRANVTALPPVSRSFHVVDPAGGTRDTTVFSDTWLGGVDEAAAFVSFEWYPTKGRDGLTRILKDIVEVPYGETESVDVGNGVRIRAAYSAITKRQP